MPYVGDDDKVKGCLAVAVVTIMVFLAVVYGVAYKSSATHTSFLVERVERVNKRDSGKYLVFTNVEVFEVTDSWLFWRWNSSDTYGQIKVGYRYRARVAGWRVPFLSMYRNIISLDGEGVRNSSEQG